MLLPPAVGHCVEQATSFHALGLLYFTLAGQIGCFSHRGQIRPGGTVFVSRFHEQFGMRVEGGRKQKNLFFWNGASTFFDTTLI